LRRRRRRKTAGIPFAAWVADGVHLLMQCVGKKLKASAEA
jgi:hypothetical protein